MAVDWRPCMAERCETAEGMFVSIGPGAILMGAVWFPGIENH